MEGLLLYYYWLLRDGISNCDMIVIDVTDTLWGNALNLLPVGLARYLGLATCTA